MKPLSHTEKCHTPGCKCTVLVKNSGLCLNCYVKMKDEANGTKPKRIMSHEEDDIQAEFFIKASVIFPKLDKLLYHACNEGRRDPKRSKRIGIKSGVADVHLAIANRSYHSLYIEFKAGTNTQTDEQIEFQRQIQRAGNLYIVCYSAADAIEILRYYLKTSNYNEL